MASGKTHDRACIVLAVCLLTGTYIDPVTALSAAAGSLAGLLLSPDLDIWSNPQIRWKALGLGWLWAPYKTLVPHRHWLSHAPVIGTIGRLTYLAAFIAIVVALYCLIAGLAFPTVNISPLGFSVLLSFFIGLCIADVAHWMLDGCPLNA